ncbi:YpmS family protein [Enterococcus sp. LJL120]
MKQVNNHEQEQPVEENPQKSLGKIKKNGGPKNPKKLKLNPWQLTFFALLAIVVGSGIFVVMRVLEPREDATNLVETDIPTGDALLSVNTDKEHVNALIDHYLEDFQQGQEVTYSFYLDNEALLTGQFTLFGFPITFYFYFDPYVLENGNVQLRATSLSIGALNMPITDMLNMVRRNFDFPDWVEFNADDQTVILHLDEFDVGGLRLRAERINLIDDELRLSIYLPGETVGSTDSTTDSEE